jgi:uncharacterized membrane protein YgdD (TMEM256/DUF423 family)
MSSAVDTSTRDARGVVVGAPASLLRLEGVALFAGSLLAYTTTGRSWWLVPLTFLFPDFSWLGYLAGTRVGARIYNLAHITPLPGVLIAVGWWQNASLAVALGLIWLAHIGLDRMLGYGLKYGDDFQHTHLRG